MGFTYIDTGAMYRAVALWAVRQGVDTGDMHRMEQLAIAAGIELSPGHIALNGEDVTDAIRTPEVSSGASKIAVIPGVRRAMVAKQREIGERTSVVMEGRDIGTVVFPNAQVKIFLDANPDERVRRRCEEMRAKGRDRQRRAARRADEGTRSARLHARRRSAGAGSGRRVSGFDRLGHRGSDREHSQDRAFARHKRKGIPLKNLLVMKFGGTSVGSAARMRVSAGLAAAEQKNRPVAIVVSAMSKVTDLLLDTMRHAEAGRPQRHGEQSDPPAGTPRGGLPRIAAGGGAGRGTGPTA